MKTTHFEPGNMSRYTITEIPGDPLSMFILWNNGGGGVAIRLTESWVHWTYVAEKMRLNDEDAKSVAHFINSKAPDYDPKADDLPRCIGLYHRQPKTGKTSFGCSTNNEMEKKECP